MSTAVTATGRSGAGGVSGPVLEIEDLEVTFPTDDGPVQAVRGVSLTVNPGEVLGIVGESGSGKSVTMLATLGLLPRTARIRGSIRFRGTELVGADERTLRGVRGAGIGMIFQDPMTSLNPVHRVGAQIVEAIRAHRDVPRRQAWAEAVDLLARVGIPNPAERARQYPHEYSGGMRQRAMIAMAMANRPPVLIADEPTTALDVTIQAQVLEVIDEVQRTTGTALVLITHDLGVIARMAHRVVVMYAGRIAEEGTVGELFDHPRHPYTSGLLHSLPRLDDADRHLTPIPGSPPSMLRPPPGCAFAPRCPMATDRCVTGTPPLEPVGSPGHRSACFYADDLATTDPWVEAVRRERP